MTGFLLKTWAIQYRNSISISVSNFVHISKICTYLAVTYIFVFISQMFTFTIQYICFTCQDTTLVQFQTLTSYAPTLLGMMSPVNSQSAQSVTDRQTHRQIHVLLIHTSHTPTSLEDDINHQQPISAKCDRHTDTFLYF